MSDTPIKTLGKYQIRGELGKGAMGVVYDGFDPALEREVAIKVMGGATVSDPELQKRFESEAKASARLQHPNIVTVFDFGYDNENAPYMAMERLRGQDLEQRIRAGSLGFREKLEILVQVCRGLSHAHKNGIVHRDIKPANVFIADSGEAKIMDFGVARLTQSSQTQTGAVLGTADYMSPEQIKGAKVDGRSDIFSAGVILYRLLTNKKPFSAENIQAVFFKVINEPPPALILPGDSDIPELQAIVDKALSKKLDERYGTADDLADDITDLMNMYHDVLNEDTVFDTLYDPSVMPEMELGSDPTDGSDRRFTTSSGRLFGTAGGLSRTHRPGTAMPPTASGRTGVPRTSAGTGFGATQVARPGTMSGTATSVGVPIQEGGGLWKFAAGAALMLVVAGGGYWFSQRSAEPVGNASPPPATRTVDVESQLDLAERSLEAGQLSQAIAALDTVEFHEPENVRAQSLRESVDRAVEEIEAAPPTPELAAAQAAPVTAAPSGPSTSERAAALAADASIAIGSGDFANAEQLLQQGRTLDASSPRWRQLEQQLARGRDQSAQARAAAEKQVIIDGLVSEATNALKAQDYPSAIASYDKALEIDPTNAQLITLRGTAQSAMQQLAAAAATSAALDIRESETIYRSSKQTDAPKGFESGSEVQVNRATKAPDNPADVMIQIHPTTVRTGDPYFLRVRIHNRGNRPIGVKSVELVSQLGTRTTGKGQQLTPMVQRVNPRETSMIWQVSGTWSEEQNTGSIQATVTLIGDDRLVKTIRW